MQEAAPDPPAGFHRRLGEWWVDGQRLKELAERFGTPCYVYSRARIEANVRSLAQAFARQRVGLYYAVKACSNLEILGLLRTLGCGFDVVSAGELERCLAAGATGDEIVFAGVGKTTVELLRAVEVGVRTIHVESIEEAEELREIVAHRVQGTRAVEVSLRVNPDVETGTHHYIATGTSQNKFGIDAAWLDAHWSALHDLRPLEISGLHFHVGSQIHRLEPFVATARIAARMIRAARQHGLAMKCLDLGGGFAVDYHSFQGDRPTGCATPSDSRTGLPVGPAEIAAAILPILDGLDVEWLLEPGRYLVADAGALLTRVVRRKSGKHRPFVVVDAAMNDLIRPALYQAYHEIVSADERGREVTPVDVVGPVCESGDFLALDRPLPLPQRGDLLAVLTAGAYGASMASNYNSRPRAPEILVEPQGARCIRRRETVEDLLRTECEGLT